MLLNRSASLLYLHKLSPPPTKFFSHFKHSYSLLLSNPSASASPPLLPSCPSFSLPRVSFFCLNPPRQRQARPFATATAAAAEGKGTDTFFADEDVSWASLGVSDKLSRALYSADIDRPSLVQAACIPATLSGKDVVVAAETGSGKKTRIFDSPDRYALLCT